MSRIFTTLITFFGLTLILSCSSKTNSKETEKTVLSHNIVEQPADKIFGINGEDVNIRTAPGKNSANLINEKATQALGETQYCKVDHSTKVEVLETKDDWSKIKVIEPDWLSKTHIGWIPSKYLISKKDEEKQSLGELDPKEYEIIRTDHKPAVANFHVF